jgi:hypothetical protein
MSTYATYQCTVCRRTKDLPTDNTRTMLYLCSITKGCAGKLFKTGETAAPKTTPPVAGVIDWYPRGQKQVFTPVKPTDKLLSLANSATGTVSMAILLSDAEAAANETLNLKLIQKRVENLASQSYAFRIIDSTTLVTGKDNAGHILRFNQAAIDEDRVFVKVNGISRAVGTLPENIVLTPNLISFNTALTLGSLVDVSVFSEKGTIDRTLTFELNNSVFDNHFGAWGNLRYVREIDTNGAVKEKKWWIYSCLQTGSINYSSGIKIDGVFQEDNVTPFKVDGELKDVRFLLSAYANENTDRYLNFYIDAVKLHDEFLMTSIFEKVNTLYADEAALMEIYPPFKLTSNLGYSLSYIKADTFVTSAAIQTNIANTLIQSKKIIGPI